MSASRTHEPSPPERDPAFRRAPANAGEALEQARQHARRAAAEAVAALHALLDAAALATSGSPSEANRVLAPLARLLENAAEGLAPDSDAVSAPLLTALADALDAEIARWEARAHDDSEARAVLRAFLGVRELLWEFGLRRREPAPGAPEPAPRAPAAAARAPRPVRRRSRVQRIPVEG